MLRKKCFSVFGLERIIESPNGYINLCKLCRRLSFAYPHCGSVKRPIVIIASTLEQPAWPGANALQKLSATLVMLPMLDWARHVIVITGDLFMY